MFTSLQNEVGVEIYLITLRLNYFYNLIDPLYYFKALVKEVFCDLLKKKANHTPYKT